jgi:hypothetical protein
MYEQLLHMQHNSSTSGFNATCVLQGYLSRNTTHAVLPKLTALPWNSYNSPTEYWRPHKGFPKRLLIILHPKAWKKLSNQPTSWRLILTRVQAWDKGFIPKGWSTQHNQKTRHPYPHKCRVTTVAQLCKNSWMWIVLSHHWFRKNKGERSQPRHN